MPTEYYELKRVTLPDPQPGAFTLRTAAIRSCGLCGTAIEGSGGPGRGQVCIPCGDLVKRGAARGAIKWDTSDTSAG